MRGFAPFRSRFRPLAAWREAPTTVRVTAGLISLLVILGIALRLRQYFANRSLWRDEAALALSFVDRQLSGLLQLPLVGGQSAPPASSWRCGPWSSRLEVPTTGSYGSFR